MSQKYYNKKYQYYNNYNNKSSHNYNKNKFDILNNEDNTDNSFKLTLNNDDIIKNKHQKNTISNENTFKLTLNEDDVKQDDIKQDENKKEEEDKNIGGSSPNILEKFLIKKNTKLIIYQKNYSLYVHNKHNNSWTKSNDWIKLLDFNTEKNMGEFIYTLPQYNTIDYDFYVSKTNLIPIDENSAGCVRSDITITDPYKNVITMFGDILKLLFTNQISKKYEIEFIGFIIKNTLCCIKIMSKPGLIFKSYNNLDVKNYPIINDIFELINYKISNTCHIKCYTISNDKKKIYKRTNNLKQKHTKF